MPFCHHADTITVAATDDKRFCLKLGEDGTLHLDRSHQYYFQVQSQIWLSNVNYCDFCVCTFPGSSEASLHVEIRHSGTPALVIQPVFFKNVFYQSWLEGGSQNQLSETYSIMISSNVDVYISRYCNETLKLSHSCFVWLVKRNY